MSMARWIPKSASNSSGSNPRSARSARSTRGEAGRLPVVAHLDDFSSVDHVSVGAFDLSEHVASGELLALGDTQSGFLVRDPDLEVLGFAIELLGPDDAGAVLASKGAVIHVGCEGRPCE